MGRKEDREAWTKKVNRDLIARNAKPIARSKYGAVKTDAGGKRFDSAKEAKRYLDLAMLQAAKEITDLKCQVPFYLNITPLGGGYPVPVGEWRADFTYQTKDGERVIEDVKGGGNKGTRTAVYALKKRIVEALYGVRITET